MRPETFGDFRLKIGKLGVRRRDPIPEKRGFTAPSRSGCEDWPNAGMPGWRHSAHRTRLRLNSLQTGNFTGKITISGPKATISKQETAAPQGLSRKFPKQTIREIFSTNREFQADNREFRDKSGSVHIFTLAWWRTSTSALPSSAFGLPAQPVDATQALNLSAGVSNCKVSRGRSFS
jgi:hypothetical protein